MTVQYPTKDLHEHEIRSQSPYSSPSLDCPYTPIVTPSYFHTSSLLYNLFLARQSQPLVDNTWNLLSDMTDHYKCLFVVQTSKSIFRDVFLLRDHVCRLE